MHVRAARRPRLFHHRVVVDAPRADTPLAPMTKAEGGRLLSDPYLFPAGETSLAPGSVIAKAAPPAAAISVSAGETVSAPREKTAGHPGVLQRTVLFALTTLAIPFVVINNVVRDRKSL